MTNKRKAAVVLAAGKGKRMKSELPKVLHPIHGKPMIRILLETLIPMGFDKLVVVIGHKGELVEKELDGLPVEFVWQKEQLGTGHAVEMARPVLGDFDGTVLVAAGDVPFLSADSVSRLIDTHEQQNAAATCLSADVDDPTGYGRIIRIDQTDRIQGIVEHKDATDEQRAINEINTGTFTFEGRRLFDTLSQLDNDNAQGEYYLTDCVKILHGQGRTVAVQKAGNSDEVLGVNSVEQLNELAGKFAR